MDRRPERSPGRSLSLTQAINSSKGANDMSFPHVAANAAPTDNPQPSAQGVLRAYVEHIERLKEKKAALAGDIRKIYAEAQSSGFDAKAVRQIIRIRYLPGHERQEYQDMLATYMHARGITQRKIDEALAVSRSRG
jgi:uncharacterized protein (UPF0335 family)